jgi:Flp pilus assembly protein TadG
MRRRATPSRRSHTAGIGSRDHGVVAVVDVLFVAIACLAVVVFLGYLGRLHAAGVQVANASQAAARAASLSPNSTAAAAAAQEALDGSGLASRCAGGARSELRWSPSPVGTWQGGSVTVVVSCTVDNAALAGLWTPGSRTIAASDSQPVDRYTR